MIKIADKMKRILNFSDYKEPAEPDETGNSNDQTEPPSEKDFPAGRKTAASAIEPAERTLTANMTGQVTLTGHDFDLHFISGSLKGISRAGRPVFDKLNSRARFETSEKSIGYTTESAFAFDGDPEYGLRTLQIEQKKNGDNRIYTDYVFNRETGSCRIICMVEYPGFKADEKIAVSAPFEFRIRLGNRAVTINSDSGESVLSTKDFSNTTHIKGSSFEIQTGSKLLKLKYIDKYNSKKLQLPEGLSIGIETIRRRRYLLLNPFGSYTPAPAECYNGIKEQFCIELEIKA